MGNSGKITRQEVTGVFEENLELLKRALWEGMDLKIHDIDEQIKNVALPPLSRRHKIQMNRLFRECVGGSFRPFPEEDDSCERV